MCLVYDFVWPMMQLRSSFLKCSSVLLIPLISNSVWLQELHNYYGFTPNNRLVCTTSSSTLLLPVNIIIIVHQVSSNPSSANLLLLATGVQNEIVFQ